MSIGKVAKALQLINQALETNIMTVKTPISGNEYQIGPLKGKDEQELKSQINPRKPESKITELLYQTIYKHILNNKNIEDENITLFEDFLKKESPLDITELYHGFNIATYQYTKNYQFQCQHCETINTIDKLEYSKFKNTSQKWDKEIPFTEYTYPITIILGDLKLQFNTKIPTLYDELMITKKILDRTTPADEIPMFTLTSSNAERCLYFTYSITITKQTDDNNPEDSKLIIDNAFDIKEIVKELPESILSDIIDKYNEEFSKYVPVYSCTLKCKECEKDNEVYYHPIMEFITRLFI